MEYGETKLMKKGYPNGNNLAMKCAVRVNMKVFRRE
jgi:hypothetical protein